MTAETAWLRLNESLQNLAPPCTGQALFTTDGLTDEQRAECASICARCPVSGPCEGYASAARVESGFWAGHSYTTHGKQPAGPRPRGGRPKQATT